MKSTDNTITTFTRWFFAHLAEKYGGDVTLNELRVINRIYSESFTTRAAHVTTLAASLNMPMSTVARAVGNLITKGWLIESTNGDDGRVRDIYLSDYAKNRRMADWAKCREIVDATLSD